MQAEQSLIDAYTSSSEAEAAALARQVPTLEDIQNAAKDNLQKASKNAQAASQQIAEASQTALENTIQAEQALLDAATGESDEAAALARQIPTLQDLQNASQ